MAEKQTRGSVPSLEPVRDFMTECGLFTIGGIAVDWSRMEIRGDKVYYLPETLIRERRESKKMIQSISFTDTGSRQHARFVCEGETI